MSAIPPAVVLTKRERQRSQALMINKIPSKPKEEPLTWQDCDDPPEYDGKYQCMVVEYPDSKKHIGLLYNDDVFDDDINEKRRWVKRMMDNGLVFSMHYCAPVFDLARELGLINDDNDSNEAIMAFIDKPLNSNEIPENRYNSLIEQHNHDMLSIKAQLSDDLAMAYQRILHVITVLIIVIISVISSIIVFYVVNMR